MTAEEAAEAAHHCGLDRTLGGFLDALAHLGTGGVGKDLGTGGIGSSHIYLLPGGHAILGAPPTASEIGRQPVSASDKVKDTGDAEHPSA